MNEQNLDVCQKIKLSYAQRIPKIQPCPYKHIMHLLKAPPLFANQVHLWVIKPPTNLTFTPLSLNQKEQNRLKKMKSKKRQWEFFWGRTLIKQLARQYSQCRLTEIEVHQEENSKPFLKINNQSSDLQYNLSHSSPYIALAFSKKQRLGIDIELIDKNKKFSSQFLKKYLSPESLLQMNKLEPQEKALFLYRQWTRYEATLKLQGNTLFSPDKHIKPNPYYFHATYKGTHDICLAFYDGALKITKFFEPDL